MLEEFGFLYMTSKILTNETSSIITLKFSDDQIRYVPKTYLVKGVKIFEHINTENLFIPCSLQDFENTLLVLNTDIDDLDLEEADSKNFAIVLDVCGLLKLDAQANAYFNVLNSIVFENTIGCSPQEYLNEAKITISYYHDLVKAYRAIKTSLDEVKHFKQKSNTFKQIECIIHLVDARIDEEGFNIDKFVHTLRVLMRSICIG